ncbi:MAG: hypothetical protein AB1427_22080, partial [Thermodesulfobacteriota bacterium]
DLKKQYDDVAEVIRRNSVLYFASPQLQKTSAPAIAVMNSRGRPAISGKAGDVITLTVYGELPQQPIKAVFAWRVNKKEGWDQLITAMDPAKPSAAITLAGEAGNICDAKVEIFSADGLVHFGYQETALVIVP